MYIFTKNAEPPVITVPQVEDDGGNEMRILEQKPAKVRLDRGRINHLELARAKNLKKKNKVKPWIKKQIVFCVLLRRKSRKKIQAKRNDYKTTDAYKATHLKIPHGHLPTQIWMRDRLL